MFNPTARQTFNTKIAEPATPPVPPGFVRLLPGQFLQLGDAVWRHTFRDFIPFSESQIKSCDTVLSNEYVIRQTTEGKRT